MAVDAAARRARWIVYLVLGVQTLLFVAMVRGWVAGAVPIAAYWAGTWSVILVIRQTEHAAHPEQVGWWTWAPLLLGGFGLLTWLRHLDREHSN